MKIDLIARVVIANCRIRDDKILGRQLTDLPIGIHFNQEAAFVSGAIASSAVEFDVKDYRKLIKRVVKQAVEEKSIFNSNYPHTTIKVKVVGLYPTTEAGEIRMYEIPGDVVIYDFIKLVFGTKLVF